MHIANDRFLQQLTKMEKSHLATCESCRDEHQKILLLCESAQYVELILPPNDLWQTIQPKLEKEERNVGPWKKLMFSAAATILFASIGWMMWSQFTLKQQLEHVLISNMLLEEKIQLQQQVTYRRASLIGTLQALDIKLMNAENTEDKLKILTERKQVIQQHIVSGNKEEGNEISI
ncbi:hypothetical protein [Thalassotalea sediminis]|uniref:hypothetical protein n=1 Tax=Thalassotalea sediminis TaxID=1759089 RepID=UPI002573278D|nr:hypothetical protein [Thalassotalea sediminis]